MKIFNFHLPSSYYLCITLFVRIKANCLVRYFDENNLLRGARSLLMLILIPILSLTFVAATTRE